MTPDQRLLMIGGYISSALYLSGCFVAGVYFHVGEAWKAALAAAGFSCFAYGAQLLGSHARPAAAAGSGASWAFGLLAGLFLIFGV